MSKCYTGRQPARWSAVCLVACLLLAAPVRAATDPLWSAYSEGPQERAALLKESQKRLEAIRVRVLQGTDPRTTRVDWSRDEDVRWLLKHRIPAVLVVERHMKSPQPDGYLARLAWIAQRLGHGRVLKEIPRLFHRAESHSASLHIMQVLADLRTKEAVKLMSNYLEEAEQETPDDLVATAALGLGRTGEAEHLPLLQTATNVVSDPLGRLQIDAARWLCGDQAALERLLEPLQRVDIKPRLRSFVLSFLAENPAREAVDALVPLALESEAEEAQRALRALVECSGYTRPPALSQVSEWPGPDFEGPKPEGGEQEEEPAPLIPQDFGDMPRDKRAEFIERVLTSSRTRAADPQRAGTAAEGEDLPPQ